MTHRREAADRVGLHACYASFGRAMSFIERWIDVHGTGAQRSDSETGTPSDYPNGFDPLKDATIVFNYVCKIDKKC